MIDHYGFCPICKIVLSFGCVGPYFCKKKHDTFRINNTEFLNYKGTKEEIELFKTRPSKNEDMLRIINPLPKFKEEHAKAILIVEKTKMARL